MAALCEKLRGSAPLAAAKANDQIIAGGDTAGERIDHLADDGALGRTCYIRTDSRPPTGGVGLQDCLALAMAAYCVPLIVPPFGMPAGAARAVLSAVRPLLPELANLADRWALR